MFFTKFFYFLKGYVIIKVSGKNVCKFISSCTNGGIKLYNIIPGECIECTLNYNDFYTMFKMSEKMGLKIKIIKESGLFSYLNKYRKRIFFPLGFLLFVLFFVISSFFLWDISVETNGNITENEVIESLKGIGVSPGVMLKKLPDVYLMKEHLLNSFDNVTWAWVYIKGVRAKVVIHEGIVPPMIEDDDAICDIVAAKDGFITEISVKSGMPVCVAGNAVNAGELLVSGTIEVENGEEKKSLYSVHADASIKALTKYVKSADYNLWEDRPIFSGRKKKTYLVNLFSHEFPIFSQPNYEYFIETDSEKNFGKFFSVKTHTFLEAEENRVQLPAEWVEEFAKRDLSAQISENLGRFAYLQSEEYVVETKGDKITVTAKMEFIEDIGVCVPR